MGRWVTSKGRRIYIPDEGEENPFKEGFKKKKEIQDIADKHNKKVWNGGAKNKELYDEADKFAESHNFNKEKTRDAAFAAFNEKWVDSVKREREGKDPIDKEESTKEKQISANKSQADERNGKSLKPAQKGNKGTSTGIPDSHYNQTSTWKYEQERKASISPAAKAQSMTESELRAYVKKNGLTKSYNIMMNTRSGGYDYQKQIRVLKDLVADDIAVKEARKKKKGK